jgi:hypothetical protein
VDQCEARSVWHFHCRLPGRLARCYGVKRSPDNHLSYISLPLDALTRFRDQLDNGSTGRTFLERKLAANSVRCDPHLLSTLSYSHSNTNSGPLSCPGSLRHLLFATLGRGDREQTEYLLHGVSQGLGNGSRRGFTDAGR